MTNPVLSFVTRQKCIDLSMYCLSRRARNIFVVVFISYAQFTDGTAQFICCLYSIDSNKSDWVKVVQWIIRRCVWTKLGIRWLKLGLLLLPPQLIGPHRKWSQGSIGSKADICKYDLIAFKAMHGVMHCSLVDER